MIVNYKLTTNKLLVQLVLDSVSLSKILKLNLVMKKNVIEKIRTSLKVISEIS